MGHAKFLTPVVVSVYTGPLVRLEVSYRDRRIWVAQVPCLSFGSAAQDALGEPGPLVPSVQWVPARPSHPELRVRLAGEVLGWGSAPGGGFGLRVCMARETDDWMRHALEEYATVYGLWAKFVGLGWRERVWQVVGPVRWKVGAAQAGVVGGSVGLCRVQAEDLERWLREC